MKNKHYLLFAIQLLLAANLLAQHSVARRWNEMLLQGIRTDLARPTVHARNLFHTSIAMYDAWAVYNPGGADTYLLGKTVHGFTCGFHRVPVPDDPKAAQEEAISFAMYRMLKHRFAESPGAAKFFPMVDALMDSLGYNKNNTSTNYWCGPAEMGNYVAKCVIAYGLQDGSNEASGYANQYYLPVNPPLAVQSSGDPTIVDLNRWQPLQFTTFTDQSGNQFSNVTPKFVSPEWGNVDPFALQPGDVKDYARDGHTYHVYHDPGPPARLDTSAVGGVSEEYKWNFALVSIWASLLDPFDTLLIDISPGASGNNTWYPANFAEMHDFYDLFNGGDHSTGRPLNPKTGQPYASEWVPRGDYARVLAEFWADGPNSETPPGHWFTILNYINDQPGLSKRIRGAGPLCDDLEWDVKSYFALGGAMHDAAVTAWSIKGWYDSVRPISAIRGMAEHGQSSDPTQPNYHPAGLPLIPGYIELIQPGDALAGSKNEYVNQIKLRTWKGPNYVKNPKVDVAGVGWIRAADWWPYQRPTFVTPPFAGYISGHSTYSRAAAELLTALTGDPYFPGGIGTFYCRQNEYLVFEDGPSVDVTLQWATYRDASDQCSLSRIFGGIHPPMDDIPGRLIGMEIGMEAMNFAEQYFVPSTLPAEDITAFKLYPNPTDCAVHIEYPIDGAVPVKVYLIDGRLAISTDLQFTDGEATLNLGDLAAGSYVVVGLDNKGKRRFSQTLIRR